MFGRNHCSVRRVRIHRCCLGKAVSVTYSECVSVALVIQHAKRVLPSVACLSVQHVSTLYRTRLDFRRKLLNIKCVFGFSLEVWRERKDQQDATVRCLLLTSVSTCFGHHYAHLQENKDRVTAFGVLLDVVGSGCGALRCRMRAVRSWLIGV